jgi:hypothetical protein
MRELTKLTKLTKRGPTRNARQRVSQRLR